MELLAPAGNLDKLKTAVLYGADAVYLAGPKFSLRGASDNFSDTELCEGIKFAHLNNCKTYVTLNAFLHDKELRELPEYVCFLEKTSVDAVIVSDLGVLTVVQLFRENKCGCSDCIRSWCADGCSAALKIAGASFHAGIMLKYSFCKSLEKSGS